MAVQFFAISLLCTYVLYSVLYEDTFIRSYRGYSCEVVRGEGEGEGEGAA